jgi:radical SAM superfamily enzyme YgiQ (UPF0313 family)
MPRTIAIIAPFIDTSQYNMDFNLRLANNNRELTLATFYELASSGFDPEQVSRGIDYGEDIPSAGFYLQGLLHQHGYETILTNKYDKASLESLAGKDIFAVCVSTTMIITTESLQALLAAIRQAMPGICIIAGGTLIWKHYMQYLKHTGDPEVYPLHTGMLFHPDHRNVSADILVVAPHGINSLLKVLKEMEKGRQGDRGTGRQGDRGTGRQGDRGTGRQGDRGTGRQGDRGTGRQGDWGTGRQGDWGTGRQGAFSGIPNLCFPGKSGFVFSERQDEQVDYNEDFTRWDLISEMPDKIPVRTSIGCPYRCRFCDFYQLFPKIFLRSKESLLKELNLARQRLGQNLAVIHVTDDNVFVTKKRLHEVCGALTESGLTHWVGFMRGGEYTDDEMDAIKHSGLLMGKIGVESGDQGQLDRMNKRQKIDKVKRGIEQLDANGISLLLTFVVGFPGETMQTLQNTADFLNNLSLSNLSVGYQVYPLVIFPLSELAEPSERKKWQLSGLMDQWEHFTMNSYEASEACQFIFREVTNVPYSYSEESFFFNRGMFTFEDRKSLFHLRQQLTIKLMENAAWIEIEPILRNMTGLMELPAEVIGEHLRNKILAPGF